MRNKMNILLRAIFVSIGVFITETNGIPIDNGVVGGPEIECGPDDIGVYFNAEKPFEGHVFVKGRYADSDCHTEDRGRTATGIKLPFTACGLSRQRSLNPRGVFVSAVVVISFHPTFVTKVDRAYRIQCFYMEADKTVDTEIEVSMLTTGEQTQLVPMPVCRYEILEGSPTGRPIKFALVGQSVYHKWTCDTDTQDTFCMRVYSCYVDDGNGDSIDLIDDDGCSIDRFLLQNLEYPMDLMAGQEAHVFKYADRTQLFFQCQIEITVKEPDANCPLPQCETNSRSSTRRGRRSAATALTPGSFVGAIDVRSQEIDTMDLDFNEPLPSSLISKSKRAPSTASQSSHIYKQTHGNYCLNSSASSLVVVLIVLASIATLGMASVIFVSSPAKKNI